MMSESRRLWVERNRERVNAKKREWRAANRDKVNASLREHYERNRERYVERAAEWAASNPEKVREAKRAYAERNPDLVRSRLRAVNQLRRSRSTAMTELDELAAREAADLCLDRDRLCGGAWEVDHIVPMNHKDASGLHNAFNLQVVPRQWNRMKGNRNMESYW